MGRLRLESGIKAIDEQCNQFTNMTRTRSQACMVNAELAAVLTVMRQDARWACQYMVGEDQFEHPLMKGLKNLRREIYSWQQPWNLIEPAVYLKPLTDVIRSEEAGAQITGVALSAIYKILAFEVFGLETKNVAEAMRSIVDAITSCRFEFTDSISEESVLLKILQVLVACMKSKASVLLQDQDICIAVNTCFRIVHQSGTKGDLLWRVARQMMHDLVSLIFSRLPELDNSSLNPNTHVYDFPKEKPDAKLSGNGVEESNAANLISTSTVLTVTSNGGKENEKSSNRGVNMLLEPYGVPCMVEIFCFLCSMLNVTETVGVQPEEFHLFALRMINSVIEIGGKSINKPRLLHLIQDDLFSHLMQLGLSPNPLILSTVCSIVLLLYHHLREKLKLQLEAFFSCVLIRLSQGKYCASYQQQEVAIEALVDFCRQPTFMPEMYANLDCEITCANIFEDIGNLLSRSAFPVNCPLSTMHVIALEGLISVLHSMTYRTSTSMSPEMAATREISEYTPFWKITCANCNGPEQWINVIRLKKHIKRRLMIGADHFNRDPKKGFEFLQSSHLLPEKLDPESVACFFRFTAGLDKNLVGDFLGNHDDFCVQVLHEFAKTFDFHNMNLDVALRLFLETFRLPGEAQKIQRVLEAFSERYYEYSSGIFADKDAAFLLSYSLIMLNTDQHNYQVKKKMTEEDFIRNNRRINAGNDLPRELLSELYHSIARNEIRILYDQGLGFPEMNSSRWIDLIRKSEKTAPYIICDSRPFLDRDMFAIISGPAIAALAVVFDYAVEEEVLHASVDGFLAVAELSAFHHLEDVLDDLIVSLCKFTAPQYAGSMEEPFLALGEDTKEKMAIETIFAIANRFGDYIRCGWRNILDCIIKLHNLGLLGFPSASDFPDDPDSQNDSIHGKSICGHPIPSPVPSSGMQSQLSGLMGRFSQLLSLDSDEVRFNPNELQIVVHQRSMRAIQRCHIYSIFTGSRALKADSLLQLARALIWAAGKPQKVGMPPDEESSAVFCLELLIAITVNNQERVMLLWQAVYDHIAGIVQTTVMPCALVEKAIFGLLRLCQHLLPENEGLADELLRSLQLILKLDARVADTYCENITRELMQLVKESVEYIKTPIGWRTISTLLSTTARHPEASEFGFQTLFFIMSSGEHLLLTNFALMVDAARSFAESRVGSVDRSNQALDLMTDSLKCLTQWSSNICGNEEELSDDNAKYLQEIGELWLQLAQGLQKICLDQREDVRNHAILSLQRCLIAGSSIQITPYVCFQCFDHVVFSLLDDLLEIAEGHSPKEYHNMGNTLFHVTNVVSKSFLHHLEALSTSSNFQKVWLSLLSRLEKYSKAKPRGKGNDRVQEHIPEILKNILSGMKAKCIFQPPASPGRDNLWDLTLFHVRNIFPSLQSDFFLDLESDVEAEVKSSKNPFASGDN